MISWIQNHLIRHGRWIFLTLLAIIIIAFVFTIGNTPGCTTNQIGYEKNLFYGHDLNSSHEMEDLVKKINISTLLNTGRLPRNQNQFNSALTNRIALLHLADKIGVPVPSENSLASYIQSQAIFSGPNGQFSRDAYTRFVDNIESNPRIQEDLIVVVLEEDYRIEQVEKALSGPGYFLSSESLSQVQLNETTFKVTTAEIDYNEFNPEIKPNEEELIQFYTNNIQRYRIPERINAGYIKFSTDEYFKPIEAFSDEELRNHFLNNRAQFVAAHKATQSTQKKNKSEEDSSPEITFEEVRSAVAAELFVETSQKLTNKAAQEFALTLYRNEIAVNSTEFQKLLDEKGLAILKISPYTIDEINNRELAAEMLESAFELSEKRYFSDAYKLEDGFGVLIFSGRLPPEIPGYETVSQSVRADYIAEEKRRLFNKKGKTLKSELSALLDAEIEFTKAAKTLGLKVTKTETFKINEAPREINQAVLQSARNMDEREVSPMITSGDVGIFVFVDEKIVPEIEADSEKITQTNNLLKQYAAFTSSNALLNELISKGFESDKMP